MQRLFYTFWPAMRALAAFVAVAVMLASLATAANAYADLPNCAQRASHADHPSTDTHADATAAMTTVPDTCCGTCDRCHGYFNVHFQGLNLAAACVLSLAPREHFFPALVHATDFISRPILPPPRSA
ncbi:MAG: hypothetical protein HY941_04685 [Gammaproteobacteria bacterium]|nr:hypothetical protein [Gammaproteobacteria bacterium]